MRNPAQRIIAASAVATLLGALTTSQPVIAAEPSIIEQGKALTFNKAKGNCLACHQIEGAELPGNIGPPLVAMKARFPDKSTLRAQIVDSQQRNPKSVMPPFGRHEILTSEEIDRIVEYVYTL